MKPNAAAFATSAAYIATLAPDAYIATHDGVFHADDVLGCAVLRAVMPQIRIVRSRDAAVVAGAAFRVDVGGSHDGIASFDHHKLEPVVDGGVILSSFGLVWRAYGAFLAGTDGAVAIVERELVRGIDALDNGQGSYSLGIEGSTAKHSTVSDMFDQFVPTWDESTTLDAAFEEAVALAERLIRRYVARALAEVKLAGIVAAAVEAQVDAPVVVVPWKGDGTEIVARLAESTTTAQFAVFETSAGEWAAQAVPPVRGSFKQRCPFPEAWAWKRHGDLAAATGVEDAIFSHGYGFFACAGSKAGAVALANLALAAKG